MRRSFDPHPRSGCGRASAADVAAHVELPAAVDRRQPGAVDLAVVRVEDLAAFPDVLVAALCLHAADDRQADDRLVLAVVGALVADRVASARRDRAASRPCRCRRRRSRRCGPATSPSWSRRRSVFHRPAGVACAKAKPEASARARPRAAWRRRKVMSCLRVMGVGVQAASEQRGVHRHQRRDAGARGAHQRRGLGQQLGEVEARGCSLAS